MIDIITILWATHDGNERVRTLLSYGRYVPKELALGLRTFTERNAFVGRSL